MDLNRAKHKVLWAINDMQTQTKIPLNKLWVSQLMIASRIKGLRKKENRVARAVAGLSAKGYVKYGDKASDHSAFINMTDEGLNALALEEFKHQQYDIVSSVVRDIFTIAVALATIYSLTISAIEQRQAQEQLKKLEQEVHRLHKLLSHHRYQNTNLQFC